MDAMGFKRVRPIEELIPGVLNATGFTGNNKHSLRLISAVGTYRLGYFRLKPG